ncbi:DUF1868 domain-containing protein [Rhizobium vallis]|uniref:DUF1868 domain-containing protein n=2 Tax=Rhizobium vallis TaxID=634290 RepID=A0A432PC24_9HYPH|nr:DUF1868 domain-containing protein [Rhizobium vallis]
MASMRAATDGTHYPNGVGTKFHADGSVKPFPGNTIICHLDPGSGLSSALLDLHKVLRTHRLSHLYTLLPPSSWHMTVFEGVVDARREPGYWPSDLPADAPLYDCNQHFERKIEHFNAPLDLPLEIDVNGWQPLVNGIALRLSPRAASQEVGIRSFRDALSRLLNIRHPEHATYEFHLSIAYLIRHPSETDRRELEGLLDNTTIKLPTQFELGAPEFCHFDDMFAFRRRFFLEGRL